MDFSHVHVQHKYAKMSKYVRNKCMQYMPNKLCSSTKYGYTFNTDIFVIIYFLSLKFLSLTQQKNTQNSRKDDTLAQNSM